MAIKTDKRKKVDFREVSDVRCPHCGMFLKVNSVNKGHKMDWVCHQIIVKQRHTCGKVDLLAKQRKNVKEYGTPEQQAEILKLQKNLIELQRAWQEHQKIHFSKSPVLI